MRTTRLVDALHEMGIEAEITEDGRWARLAGERCSVYVAEVAQGRGFLTWCDDPALRRVERHDDPVDAIRAGLQRAAHPAPRGGREP
jgi:hypothetical protein